MQKLIKKGRYKLRRYQYHAYSLIGQEKQMLKNRTGKRILVYHGVNKEGKSILNTRFISEKYFEQQIRFFKENFNVVTLDQYYTVRPHSTKLTVAITFDDGYLNNLQYALPILEKYGIPATFFITGIMNTDAYILWPDLLDLFSYTHSQPISINGEIFSKNKTEYRSNSRNKTLKVICKNESWAFKQEMLSIMSKKINADDLISFKEYWMQMDRESIRLLSQSPLATVGSHGYYHNNLGEIDLGFAEMEIKKSKLFLEDCIQKEVDSIAFPDGSYSKEVLKICDEVGFTKQLALEYVYKNDHHNPHLKNRFGINPFIDLNDQLACILRGSYY